MKNMLLLIALMSMSNIALASGREYNESGPGPIQDHTCQGGHNCNTTGGGGHNEQDQGQSQRQSQEQSQAQAQSQGQSQEASATSIADASNRNSNESTNTNLNVAYGGEGGQGGAGGEGGQGGNAFQGQSQFSDNSNSSNNSSSQSTNVTFEGTGKANHYNDHGNNVTAFAPAIYSSSACTGGGLSAGASAIGMGVSIGGAKQDKQCQVRENARILSGLDTNLAIMYLCANPLVDVGTVLGSACKPSEPPIFIPTPTEELKKEIPVPVVDSRVKG
jgi:hypothetical protein